MKRFITYLYEYNQGSKTKNVGFLRIDIRENWMNMEVCIKNYIQDVEKGNIFVLVNEEKLMGIDIGEVTINNGLCNKKFSVDKSNLADSGYKIQNIAGVAICFDKDGYLASCWKDERAEDIAKGVFSIYTNEVSESEQMRAASCELFTQDVNTQEISEPQTTSLQENVIDQRQKKEIIYKKIELDQIRELPSSNWHLSNNKFLLHGVLNYGYLFIKKETDNSEERLWLGVPGYYEKPELFMALLFGFTEFESVPKKIVDLELNIESQSHNNIEKNQEPKTGIFGGWFVMLTQ